MNAWCAISQCFHLKKSRGFVVSLVHFVCYRHHMSASRENKEVYGRASQFPNINLTVVYIILYHQYQILHNRYYTKQTQKTLSEKFHSMSLYTLSPFREGRNSSTNVLSKKIVLWFISTCDIIKKKYAMLIYDAMKYRVYKCNHLLCLINT
jgi:hypothetical protein